MNFNFKFLSNLEKFLRPMEKVIPLIKSFKTIFYFKIFEVGKILFEPKQV
jgi:hypothetical protein